MATAGILRPENVVFYHPLNNFTEYTQNQTWSGSAGFADGKIGTGVSAIAADSFAAGPITANATASFHALAPLGDSKVVMAYHKGGKHSLRVGTVSGSDITLGPEVQYSTVPGNTARSGLVTMDSGTGTLILSFRGPSTGEIRVVTVSGTNVTVGPVTTFVSAPRGIRLTKLDSTHAAMMYSKYNGGAENGEALIVTMSGNAVTIGAAYQFDIGLTYNAGSAVALTSTTFMLAWVVAGAGKVSIATVSGTDITYGAAQDLSPDPDEAMTNMVLLDSATVFLAYTRNTYNLMGRVASVSGASFTLGPQAQLTASAIGIGLARLSSTEVAYTWRSSSPGSNMTKATVSGTDITFGATTQYHAPGISGEFVAVAMSANKIVASHQIGSEGSLATGTLSLASNAIASTPGAYPAVTGNDRVALAMWVNKLGAGASTITVQRDFTVEFTSATIAIGPATATWSDAAIVDLMSATAAGEHFLVLDFEHTDGGSWTLRTSLDGAAFVNQGTQDSGTRSTAPASLAAGVAIAAGESGQWIDELVMWSGDKTLFEVFEAQELANLFDLADTFGESMDQFEENFGAPLCWQATAKMPDGSVWRDSGSGPCPPVVRVPKGAGDIVVTDDGNPVSPRIVEG